MTTNIDKMWLNLEKEVERRGGDGKDFISAMKELYAVWDEGLYKWVSKLWCPEEGGFYYSNSARDNEPFLPDIESTLQALGIICRSGMVSYDGLPEDIKEGVRRFLKKRFDPTDGYFYHPQWGKNIIDARRGRDLMWAETMMKWFDVTLPAKTASERLRAASTATREEKAKITENMPQHLRSEEAFLAYLRSWDWENQAYVSGNNLVAQSNQIVAAGLAPVAIGFLNSIQNRDNGFWGNSTGYDAVNGYLKITSFYVDARAPVNYAKKAAMAIMDVLFEPEKPAHVCCQYNVWFSIGNLLEIFKKLGNVMDKNEADEIRREILRRAPAAIRATIPKLLHFKKPDGSFSYTPTASSYVSQNAWVAIKGTNEGDVNASIICSVEILHKIYRALELNDFAVPIFTEKDYENIVFPF